jgi:hypothetical protein
MTSMGAAAISAQETTTRSSIATMDFVGMLVNCAKPAAILL